MLNTLMICQHLKMDKFCTGKYMTHESVVQGKHNLMVAGYEQVLKQRDTGRKSQSTIKTQGNDLNKNNMSVGAFFNKFNNEICTRQKQDVRHEKQYSGGKILQCPTLAAPTAPWMSCGLQESIYQRHNEFLVCEMSVSP